MGPFVGALHCVYRSVVYDSLIIVNGEKWWDGAGRPHGMILARVRVGNERLRVDIVRDGVSDDFRGPRFPLIP